MIEWKENNNNLIIIEWFKPPVIVYITKKIGKVENIWNGSLDLIPPSVKIQIMSRKVCLLCKVGIENKKNVDITQQCFALLPLVNSPANNLNFHWRWSWWDQIKAIFLNLFYFTHLQINIRNCCLILKKIEYISWKVIGCGYFKLEVWECGIIM